MAVHGISEALTCVSVYVCVCVCLVTRRILMNRCRLFSWFDFDIHAMEANKAFALLPRLKHIVQYLKQNVRRTTNRPGHTLLHSMGSEQGRHEFAFLNVCSFWKLRLFIKSFWPTSFVNVNLSYANLSYNKCMHSHSRHSVFCFLLPNKLSHLDPPNYLYWKNKDSSFFIESYC